MRPVPFRFGLFRLSGPVPSGPVWFLVWFCLVCSVSLSVCVCECLFFFPEGACLIEHDFFIGLTRCLETSACRASFCVAAMFVHIGVRLLRFPHEMCVCVCV